MKSTALHLNISLDPPVCLVVSFMCAHPLRSEQGLDLPFTPKPGTQKAHEGKDEDSGCLPDIPSQHRGKWGEDQAFAWGTACGLFRCFTPSPSLQCRSSPPTQGLLLRCPPSLGTSSEESSGHLMEAPIDHPTPSLGGAPEVAAPHPSPGLYLQSCTMGSRASGPPQQGLRHPYHTSCPHPTG